MFETWTHRHCAYPKYCTVNFSALVLLSFTKLISQSFSSGDFWTIVFYKPESLPRLVQQDLRKVCNMLNEICLLVMRGITIIHLFTSMSYVRILLMRWLTSDKKLKVKNKNICKVASQQRVITRCVLSVVISQAPHSVTSYLAYAYRLCVFIGLLKIDTAYKHWLIKITLLCM